MSGAVPPPPPPNLPPPPVATNLPLPLPLPLPGGLPPPVNTLPPPPMTGGRSGGPMPFTNNVLITSAPKFLHSFRAVREWLYPCGSTRTVFFYPRPKRGYHDNKNGTELKHPESLPQKITILVTMGHPDAAIKFLASFKEFSGRLDERYSDIDAYMVPNSPDVPLPPPVVDQKTSTVLGEKLWQNFVGLEAASGEGSDDNGASATNTWSGKENQDIDDPSKPLVEEKLDANKVAAAAGGAYDPDEDPLNAPQVLEAVKEFRRKLEKTQTFQQKRRIELVQQKLQQIRPRIVEQMTERRKMRMQQPTRSDPGGVPTPLPLLAPPPQTSLPPPPMPTGLPPPPGGPLPPPTVQGSTTDSGKRGRSNLPAWMTQQQQQETSTEIDETAAKKSKTYPTNFPSDLAPSTHPVLRDFLTNQVKESLGEEEKTLIDFLYHHILQGKTTSQLLQELQVVLEEESDGFLRNVWAKVDDLAKVAT